MKTPLCLFLAAAYALTPGCALAQSPARASLAHAVDAGKQDSAKAAAALASRLLGEPLASRFVFEVVPLKEAGTRTFTLEGLADGRIRITGDDAVTLAAGLNGYLREVAKCHVSWCHDRVALPNPLPKPEGVLTRTTRERHGAAFNYCTYNYTMAWWDEARWMRELDLLALQGFDRPLAIMGSEAVWMNVLKRFGYTTEEARATLCGPAYTAWWLMGNIEGVGGPVTDATIAKRVALQRALLARMRELDMRPVFQGFVGIVPASLGKRYPNAKIIDQGQWCAMPRPPVIHPDDPLFDQLSKAWYEELAKLYGRADLFAGDLFHEGGRVDYVENGVKKRVDVTAMARKVQNHMLAHDPEAVWSLQGWSGNPQASLLKGLRTDRTEVVELCNEAFTNWNDSKGFSGKPWVFGTIIQYGGNVALHGRLPVIERNFAAARASANPPVGIGYIWESTEVNPVVADLLADLRWREGRTDLDKWVGDYGVRRYGLESPKIRKAWSLLLKTAYNEYPGARRPTESIFCGRPGPAVTKASPFAASVRVHYDLRELRQAIVLMLEESPRLQHTDTYRHDLVDFTRQYLAGAGLVAYEETRAADAAGDREAYTKACREFLEMIDAQDKLLGTEKYFLVGRWLKSARDSAPAGEADAYEEQARALITTWFIDRKPASLADYAWREWSGLLRDFYKPRWEAWFQHRIAVLAAKGGKPAIGKPDWHALEVAWTKKTLKTNAYPATPVGDPVAEAKAVMARWGALPDDAKRYRAPAPVAAGRVESAADAR